MREQLCLGTLRDDGSGLVGRSTWVIPDKKEVVEAFFRQLKETLCFTDDGIHEGL